MAELDAYVPFSPCVASCGCNSFAVRSQIVLPVRRSMASTANLYVSRGRSCPRGACDAVPSTPCGTAESRKIRSPHTTGDADPRPGISTFHRMFFVSLHSVGGLAVFETPVAYGPRH